MCLPAVTGTVAEYVSCNEVLTIQDLLCMAAVGTAARRTPNFLEGLWHDQVAKETLSIVQSVVCKARVMLSRHV